MEHRPSNLPNGATPKQYPEDTMIAAHSRLCVLAHLMQNSANSDFAFDPNHLVTLGDMIRCEAERAKAAFYEVYEVRGDQRADLAGTNDAND